MKPVFIEDTITKLKRIIESASPSKDQKDDIHEITDQIEKSLKDYKDNKENRTFLYSTSAVVVLLSIILTYSTKSTWPLMFLVIWFGLFSYYRVHERGLVLNNLEKIGKVKFGDILSKITFLKSALDLKIGRKSVLKIFLAILISCSVMMAHYLFVDTSFWMNLGLLVAAIIASYFFWESFYKDEMKALFDMKNQLHQLENQIILSGGLTDDEEE